MAITLHELGAEVVGFIADAERWNGVLPPYRRPERTARGVVVTIYTHLPEVVEIQPAAGPRVLVRDARRVVRPGVRHAL
jgi:hypothetical protein